MELALSRVCNDQDVITQLSVEEEQQRQEYARRYSQNYLIPFSKYSAIDWGRLMLSGKRARFKQHMPAQDIRRIVGEHVWNSYHKFCVERNPWDRLISYYYWRTRNLNRERPSFAHFMTSDEKKRYLSNFNLYTINDRLAVDCVIQYENLKTELPRLAELLHFPTEIQLPRAKSTQRMDRRPYRQVLTPGDCELIQKVCAKEIALFNYQF